MPVSVLMESLNELVAFAVQCFIYMQLGIGLIMIPSWRYFTQLDLPVSIVFRHLTSVLSFCATCTLSF